MTASVLSFPIGLEGQLGASSWNGSYDATAKQMIPNRGSLGYTAAAYKGAADALYVWSYEST